MTKVTSSSLEKDTKILNSSPSHTFLVLDFFFDTMAAKAKGKAIGTDVDTIKYQVLIKYGLAFLTEFTE